MPWLIGSRNMSQMVNCILSFLLIIVKNNKTTGVKNEKVEWIKLKYPAPISLQKRARWSYTRVLKYQLLKLAELTNSEPHKRTDFCVNQIVQKWPSWVLSHPTQMVSQEFLQQCRARVTLSKKLVDTLKCSLPESYHPAPHWGILGFSTGVMPAWANTLPLRYAPSPFINIALRQGLTGLLRLALNSLCSPGWPAVSEH